MIFDCLKTNQSNNRTERKRQNGYPLLRDIDRTVRSIGHFLF